MNKIIVIPLIGLVVTFSLFAFMAKMVASEQKPEIATLPPVTVSISQTPPPSQHEEIKRVKFTPPPVKNKPQVITEPVDKNNASTPSFIFETPTLSLVNKVGTKQFTGPGNGDARPIFRVNPSYPIEAARDGVEGWVMLGFDINRIGQVANVRIIDAQPSRVFNKAAIKALKKWKYKPKIENGEQIEQHNLTVQLDFKMKQSI